MLDQLVAVQFAIHGGADGMSGGIGLLSAVLDAIGGWIALPSEQKFSALLPGIAVMHNLHPLAVHFPIALLTFFVFIECVNLFSKNDDYHRFASGLLYLGAVTAAITVALGFIAAEGVAHDDATHELMETHEHLAISLLLLTSVLAGWRFFAKQRLQGGALHFYSLLTTLLAVLLILTADLGGAMVYGRGVAVAPWQALNQHANEQHEHAAGGQ